MDNDTYYHTTEAVLHTIDDASISVRTLGSGPYLLFIHGFGVDGSTWRRLLPHLSASFTCVIVDLPGFGESKWHKHTDFTFTAQAQRLGKLMKQLGINCYHLVAQDTGASIARILALKFPAQVEGMVLINTEIPKHRPPYIPLYQAIAHWPGMNWMFRNLMKVNQIVRSPLLFNQFYSDKSLLKHPDYLTPYIQNLKSSSLRMEGLLKYLRGIEWQVIDGFEQTHQALEAEVLLLWGEDDRTFPVKRAEAMTAQFSPKANLERVKNASLMPHEEKPQEVANHILDFLTIKAKI